jgi:hypothetical protein
MDNVVMNKHATEISFARNWRPQTDDDKCITELAGEIVRLCQQIAELEPDARLGRLVREMPRNAKLGHECQQWGEWYAVWPGDNLYYNRQYGNTPEEALQAAQKKEK